MSDDQKQGVELEIDRESGDDDLETEGHVKPNADGTGELDQEGVAPDDRDY